MSGSAFPTRIAWRHTPLPAAMLASVSPPLGDRSNSEYPFWRGSTRTKLLNPCYGGRNAGHCETGGGARERVCMECSQRFLISAAACNELIGWMGLDLSAGQRLCWEASAQWSKQDLGNCPAAGKRARVPTNTEQNWRWALKQPSFSNISKSGF